ncbi:Hypothetical predicted protein [Octopus vulgaris]|uniref:Uncharacterized protein n=1 Tax=Octopus vulgaris TaxID=6645 RepID=A0AA36BLC3_OCTVU|nr:Hypothetical predicted protein [Octopus vulgaris]
MDFYIRPKRRPQGQKVTRKLNITKLKNQLTAQDLQSRMDSKLLDIRNDQSSIDEQWESFRDTVHSIALETLGQVTRNHQDWFDENDQEIQKLLEEKRRLLRLTKMTPPARQRRLLSTTFAAQSRQNSASCKTHG